LMVNSARASERARAFYTACGFDEEAIMHFKIR